MLITLYKVGRYSTSQKRRVEHMFHPPLCFLRYSILTGRGSHQPAAGSDQANTLSRPTNAVRVFAVSVDRSRIRPHRQSVLVRQHPTKFPGHCRDAASASAHLRIDLLWRTRRSLRVLRRDDATIVTNTRVYPRLESGAAALKHTLLER